MAQSKQSKYRTYYGNPIYKTTNQNRHCSYMAQLKKLLNKIVTKKSNTLKDTCKHCNNLEYYTYVGLVVHYIKYFFYQFGIFSFIFFVFLGFCISLPPEHNNITDDIINIVQVFGATTMTYHASANDLQMRETAINITRGCQDDQMCNMLELYFELEPFDYTPSGVYQYKLYTPEETYNMKAGDCKNMAYLFASLYSQVGGQVTIKCHDEHCYDVVNIDDKLYLVDLSGDTINYGKPLYTFFDYRLPEYQDFNFDFYDQIAGYLNETNK